jgi:nucleotidyltransferase substrate binding protein (TIGR01987 family)
LSLSSEELVKAVRSLEEAVHLQSTAKDDSIEKNVFRDACIQRFEYCIELAWKLSMRLLGSTTAAAKPAVREMARNNLIQNPSEWIDFIEARNNTSHTYDEEVAAKVFLQIQKFLPHVQALLAELQKITK